MPLMLITPFVMPVVATILAVSCPVSLLTARAMAVAKLWAVAVVLAGADIAPLAPRAEG